MNTPLPLPVALVAWTARNVRAGNTPRLTGRELFKTFGHPSAHRDPNVEATRQLHALDANGVCTECAVRETRWGQS